jgi:hypothetical protein
MFRIKITILLTVFIAPFSLMAADPQSKEEQCTQYGSYQDADGTWQVCEVESIAEEGDS